MTDDRRPVDCVDPLIDTPKTWKDVYQYDEGNRLIGWTRQRGDQQQHFTADGARSMTLCWGSCVCTLGEGATIAIQFQP